MDMNRKKIILGDEYDEDLKGVVRKVLIENGAVELDKSWNLGGSQEIETLQIKLGDEVITVEAETFIGLTIEGPEPLVENLAKKIVDQHNRR
jgi:hypothetical protein